MFFLALLIDAPWYVVVIAMSRITIKIYVSFKKPSKIAL